MAWVERAIATRSLERRAGGAVHPPLLVGARLAGAVLANARSLVILAVMVLALGIVVALGAALVPRVLGYQPVVVHGASMASGLPIGSIAVTEEVRAGDVAVGDVILFRPPEASSNSRPVMHRVTSVREDGGQRLFRTKGDANATPDPWEVALEGRGQRLVYSVPYMGYLVSFARSPLGYALLLALPGLYLGASLLRGIWAGETSAR